MLDKSINIVFDPQYSEIQVKNYYPSSTKSLDFILFVRANNKWGAVTIKNEIKVPLEFESIDFANSDYLIVEKDKRKHFYDLNKRKLLKQFSFDNFVLLPFYSRLEKNNKQTLIDNATFDLIFPFKFDEIYFEDKTDLFVVKLGEKYGVVNLKGEQIIPTAYDYLSVWKCEQTRYLVRKDNKYAIIDDKNKVVLPFKKDILTNFDDRVERQLTKTNKKEIFDCELKKINK